MNVHARTMGKVDISAMLNCDSVSLQRGRINCRTSELFQSKTCNVESFAESSACSPRRAFVGIHHPQAAFDAAMAITESLKSVPLERFHRPAQRKPTAKLRWQCSSALAEEAGRAGEIAAGVFFERVKKPRPGETRRTCHQNCRCRDHLSSAGIGNLAYNSPVQEFLQNF